MKKIIIIQVLILSLLSCAKQETKDYVTLSGKITNNSAINIDIGNTGFDKRITVNPDGTFKDTLKVLKTGYFSFEDGKNKTFLHLKNGANINMNYDYKDYVNTVKFTGKGSEISDYLVERKKIDVKENFTDVKSYFKLSSKEFIKKLNRVENKISEILKAKGLDSELIKNELSRNTKTIAYLKKNYAKQHEQLVKFAKGTPSPKFVNYEKFGGGKVSLDNFKGKYLYIDVWATWCGPCKREIPSLKSLYKDFKDKNITFISISVDNGRGYKNDAIKAKEGWKKMIKNKNMKWMQLYADKDWRSDFIKAYGINSIPRFILIDDKGEIVNAHAPRPSNEVTRKLLTEVLN